MKQQQILLNAVSTLAQVIGSAGVLFCLYRFLIRAIGIERLGIWSLVLATTSVVTLANQGFSTSIVKFVAKYVAREQTEYVSTLIQTALISVGLTLAIVSAGLYPAAKWILTMLLPHHALGEAFSILPYALISLWINIVSSILLAGLAGHELVSHRNFIVLGSTAFYLLLSYLFVPRYGLLGLAYSQTAQAAETLLIAWILLRRQVSGFPIIPRRFSRALFHEMLNYGLHFQFITASQAVREPVTKALLTKFGGLVMTGYYDLASRWVVNFRELIVQANQVLVPTISHLQERDPKFVPPIYRESYRLVFFLAIPLFAFLVVLSPLVSQIWIGRYEPVFVRFVMLLALGWLVNVLCNPAYVMDLGTGELYWVSVGCVTTGILNLMLGIFLGRLFGGSAVVASTVISLILGYLIVLVSYHLQNRIRFEILLPKESVWICITSLASACLFLPWISRSLGSTWYTPHAAWGLFAALLIMIIVPMWLHPMRKRLFNWVLSRVPA